MKKRIAIVLTLILATGTFTACTAEKVNEDKTKRNSVAVSSLHLLRALSNILKSRLRFEGKQKSQQTDKKLQQKINDKKQAQGLH